MSSVLKALELLAHFSTTRPEIGLSQLCRLAGRDKATTYRHLQALQDAGFVEQNHATKNYRLGPALLQLARLRERTVPRKAGAEGPLAALADSTGETTHVSVLSGTTLYALASCESAHHSTRAVIDIDTFPLHATASGLCALAFGPDTLIAALSDLPAFTDKTPTSAEALHARIEDTRTHGFGRSLGTFEADVHSLSAPIFDENQSFAGALSVASVATRFDAALEVKIKHHLVETSRAITRNWGGHIPDTIEQKWALTLAAPPHLEPTP